MTERKRKLEADIAAALGKFSDETGLLVDSIYIDGLPYWRNDGETGGVVYGRVEVTAKLP